jgi:ribonuclease E
VGGDAAASEPAAEPPVRRRRARQPAATAAASTSESASAGQSGSAGEPAGAGPAPIVSPPAVPSPAASNAAGPAAAPPAATFQPPLVIFQPPALDAARPAATAPAGRRKDASGPDAPAPDAIDDGPDQPGDEPDDDGETRSRRRRRGGRGHGSGRNAEDAADSAERPAETGAAGKAAGGKAAAGKAAGGPAADGEQDQDGEDDGEGGTGPRRRRRRRRSGSGGDGGDVTPDDPPNTVVHVRQPRTSTTDITDVRGVKGSTRLEAKRQRRREGRETGRRRPPIITESEFLARREAVERVMVVRQRGDRTQIAVLEDGVLVEHYVDKASHQSYVGNVYLGKVQNVLPSMEAAFVDIGKGRNAVLYAGEVNFDASGLEGESKRIESALKSGQSILVQVTKDPIGHKGARLTSQVSLPGRYLVYVPGASMTGISRKLPDTERARLKQILKQVMPEGAGVIVRTAAEGASEEELSRDVSRLAAQWEAIERKSKTATAPDLLYSEPDLTIRVVRDIFNEDFGKLVIASDGEWDIVDEYVRYVAPHLAERLERWDDDKDVFAGYRIDEQLAKALDRKVWLPSGGSLVIDPTEAMTVIDVNTGKFTGQGGNLEQTVTRNNLEAAEEIVRQLRLRDVGGIIVIDFIDMVLESNRELVLRRLLECLARDRTKHQVAEVTSLGLVQMTRKRVGSGLLEAFSVTCEHCNGRGVLVSMEPVDHTPAHGRDEGRGRGDDRGRGDGRGDGDGRGKDDGKSSGGRGSRGGRQAKGDGSRGGRNGRSAEAAQSETGQSEVGQFDAAVYSDAAAQPDGSIGLVSPAGAAPGSSGPDSGGPDSGGQQQEPTAAGSAPRRARSRGRAVREVGPADYSPVTDGAASVTNDGAGHGNGSDPAGSAVAASPDGAGSTAAEPASVATASASTASASTASVGTASVSPVTTRPVTTAASAPAGPATTESATTEPVTTEPVTTESASTEPAAAETTASGARRRRRRPEPAASEPGSEAATGDAGTTGDAGAGSPAV